MVVTADGGNQALALLKSNPVSVILSDYRMPDGDGLQLLNGLRARDDLTPFIFMTGFSDITVAQAKIRGAFDLIQKPFGLDEILKLFEQALAK